MIRKEFVCKYAEILIVKSFVNELLKNHQFFLILHLRMSAYLVIEFRTNVKKFYIKFWNLKLNFFIHDLDQTA